MCVIIIFFFFNLFSEVGQLRCLMQCRRCILVVHLNSNISDNKQKNQDVMLYPAGHRTTQINAISTL